MKGLRNFGMVFLLALAGTVAMGQPVNDECTGAIDLGSLPVPNCCGGQGCDGIGATVNFAGLTNVSATAPNPYVYVADCQGSGTDMANPAQDVWYSFTATGNAVSLDLSNYTGSFTNPSIGFWEGTCASLTARGCINGTGTSLSTTLEPVTPGETYYLQISGEDGTSEGTFDLALSNFDDCSQCNLSSNLTVSPLPTNGTYTVATEVTFCYTVSEYDKVSSNWMHGVTVENLGSGWDLTFGTNGISNPTVSPSTCENGYGEWIWDDSPPNCIGNTSPGWYYLVNGSNSSCNNYGDPGLNESGGNGCELTFCFTLRTLPISSCDPFNPASLAVTVNTSADGETGSWTSAACENDPSYQFSALQACCDAPVTNMDAQVTCYGGSDGEATVTAGSISNPFTYRWFGPTGTLDFETNGTASSTDTQTGLTQGIYTVLVIDNNGCTAADTVNITSIPGATVTADTNQAVCPDDNVTVASFVVSPADAKFEWTATSDVGFGTFDSTQIGSFTAVNSTTNVITSDVTVTPIAANGCSGQPQNFSITVNPSPAIALPADETICDDTVDIVASFDPDPVTSTLEFTNSGLVVISTNAGGGGAVGTGNTSITVSGVEPTILDSGQIVSACFSIKHQCYNDIDYFTLTINGTTYTSTNGSPAGATYNSDLADLLDTIHAATNDQTIELCMPQSFLDLFNGTSANTTWDLSVNDATKNNCGGGAPKTGDIVDFTVEIDDTPSFGYLWSPTTSLDGPSSGTTTVDTLPMISVSPSDTTTYSVTLTDPNGCVGVQAITMNYSCILLLETIDLIARTDGVSNVLKWTISDLSEVKLFTVERTNDEMYWINLGTVFPSSSSDYLYRDYSYESGSNYYRIATKYSDGSVMYSNVDEVRNNATAGKIKAVYNTLGQEVSMQSRGMKYILYEDGTRVKVFVY